MSNMLLLLRKLDIQRRVIGALLMREIYTRFGREGLGFVWIILEPLVFALPVLTLWSIVRTKYEHGLLFMPVLVSGYMAILLFRHLGGSMMMFVRANASLLYHPNVTLMDIFWARATLEIVSNLSALIVTFCIFIASGSIDLPADLPMFYLGYFFMIWWCIVVGLFVGALAERSRFIEKAWPVYSYTYVFFSGFLYLADWLPPRLRQIALYQPSLQAYEMIRAGMFGNIVRTYGDPVYTAFCLGILTLIGFWAMREARRHVVVGY